ncbi:MAG: DUF4411 family protein, partial [Candidatus Micrarchaeota archaeon]
LTPQKPRPSSERGERAYVFIFLASIRAGTIPLLLGKIRPLFSVPSLWKGIEAQIENEHIISHSLVLDELEKVDDGLHKWFGNKKNKKMFKSQDDDQLKKVKEIMAEFERLVDHEKESTCADPFVIALALQRKEVEKKKKKNPREVVLVTDESIGTRDRPKIPDVCRRYNVTCIKHESMFHELGLRGF